MTIWDQSPMIEEMLAAPQQANTFDHQNITGRLLHSLTELSEHVRAKSRRNARAFAP
jgi:hypothetical protein